jgi:hypothetical protein
MKYIPYDVVHSKSAKGREQAWKKHAEFLDERNEEFIKSLQKQHKQAESIFDSCGKSLIESAAMIGISGGVFYFSASDGKEWKIQIQCLGPKTKSKK